MIGGLSLEALSARLLEDARAHRDFIADTRHIDVDAVDGKAVIRFATADATVEASPTRHALLQIGSTVGIPTKYLDRLAEEAPSLLAANVNHWFRAAPSPRMLRTKLNGAATLRAFLSNRYRPLDNYQLAEAVIPKLLAPGWEIKSAQITESRFYIQAISTSLGESVTHARRNGTKDDLVHPGIVISNSEVGAGALSIEPMIFRLVCLNGMIAGSSIRRNHIGRSSGGAGEDAYEFYSDETRRLDDAALWAKVGDTVDAAVSEALFRQLVGKLNAATADDVGDDPVSVVEVTARRFGLDEREQSSVLRHLASGGDLTRFGLLNAVTRVAEDAKSYDRAIELERFGGEILELPRAAFTHLN